jgi:hypothetical protein
VEVEVDTFDSGVPHEWAEEIKQLIENKNAGNKVISFDHTPWPDSPEHYQECIQLNA